MNIVLEAENGSHDRFWRTGDKFTTNDDRRSGATIDGVFERNGGTKRVGWIWTGIPAVIAEETKSSRLQLERISQSKEARGAYPRGTLPLRLLRFVRDAGKSFVIR